MNHYLEVIKLLINLFETDTYFILPCQLASLLSGHFAAHVVVFVAAPCSARCLDSNEADQHALDCQALHSVLEFQLAPSFLLPFLLFVYFAEEGLSMSVVVCCRLVIRRSTTSVLQLDRPYSMATFPIFPFYICSIGFLFYLVWVPAFPYFFFC